MSEMFHLSKGIRFKCYIFVSIYEFFYLYKVKHFLISTYRFNYTTIFHTLPSNLSPVLTSDIQSISQCFKSYVFPNFCTPPFVEDGLFASVIVVSFNIPLIVSYFMSLNVECVWEGEYFLL